jgi:uncharacterized membrane protein YjjB (DUF3815 family)
LLGLLLIWAGVLAWVPFLLLAANSAAPSIFPFLAAHLAGVLGGAWLRRSADASEGIVHANDQFGRRRKIVSTVMIYLGVLAWAPYFYLDKFLQVETVITPFLALHLTGVLGGLALRGSVEVQRLRQKR